MGFENDSVSEFVFIVDRSGSMSGSKMKHTVDALQLCLRSLPEGSYFNIVSFGSRFKCLFMGGKPCLASLHICCWP